MPLRSSSIAIVGATGAVGREVLSILAERNVPQERVIAFASDRSEGTRVQFGNESIAARSLSTEAFVGVETAIVAVSADLARHWVPIAKSAGVDVIDNSSAFRLDPEIPLVVPEINPHAIGLLRRDAVVVANPNCSTVLLLMALNPIRIEVGIEKVFVATYQAVSGAGLAAMDELREQTGAVLGGRLSTHTVFREPCAFNVFSHDSAVNVATGLNGEERKIIDETRKIWNDARVLILPTCVRVPVLRAHTQAVTFTTNRPTTVEHLQELLSKAPGLRLIDDREKNTFPTPLKATGKDDVLVGRLRAAEGGSPGVETREFSLLLSGDQLRKGAALNAIQIAELLSEQRRRSRTATQHEHAKA